MHAHTRTRTHTHTHTQAVTRKERCHVEEAQYFILTSGSHLEVRGSLTNPFTDWEIEPRGRGDVSWRRREGGREGRREREKKEKGGEGIEEKRRKGRRLERWNGVREWREEREERKK